MRPEIQHEVAGAIANLHIPQGDWGEDNQMDFSDPPPGGFQTTKARTRGSGSSMDVDESSDTRRNSNQKNAGSEKRENFTKTEEERRKRSDIFVRKLAGKFAGVEATTRRREEVVDSAG